MIDSVVEIAESFFIPYSDIVFADPGEYNASNGL
jgi:hypothetical protein